MIQEFTGLDSPYEPPPKPDLVIPAHTLNVEDSINLLTDAVSRLISK
jgi:adenylylsulfate kinase-like enzyme